VKKYLQSDHFEASAFICLTDRTAVGTLAACHEAGIRVPEEKPSPMKRTFNACRPRGPGVSRSWSLPIATPIPPIPGICESVPPLAESHQDVVERMTGCGYAK
jgi:hypothetical protein